MERFNPFKNDQPRRDLICQECDGAVPIRGFMRTLQELSGYSGRKSVLREARNCEQAREEAIVSVRRARLNGELTTKEALRAISVIRAPPTNELERLFTVADGDVLVDLMLAATETTDAGTTCDACFQRVSGLAREHLAEVAAKALLCATRTAADTLDIMLDTKMNSGNLKTAVATLQRAGRDR